MRKYVLFVLLVIVLFVNVTDAQAAKRRGKHAKWVPTCTHLENVTFQAPVLSTYLSQIGDGGDPLDFQVEAHSFYRDYLGDFQWWANQQNLCPSEYSPEPYPYTE